MKPSANRPVLRQIVWTAIYIAVTAAVVVSFLKIFEPTPYEAPVPFARGYDRSVMQAALEPDAVRATLGEIEALGSRAPGQPGLAATRDMLRQRFRDAGLECLEHEIDVAYPLSETLRLEAGGTELGVGFWPAPPNFIQPGVTPADGLTGELMLVTEANVRAATEFTNKIAVVDMARPLFKELALNPAQYCDLGFQAMIVTHAGGLDQIPWSQLYKLRLTIPLNYVRLVAEPEILEHVGKSVCLKVRTAYRNEQTHNLIGVMRAPGGGSRRALLIGASYDAASVLPDLACGSAFALQTALQLRMLEGLGPHRDTLKRDVIFLATSADSMAHTGVDSLLAAVGMIDESAGVRTRLETEQRRHTDRIETLDRIDAMLEDPRFASEIAASGAALDAADGATREFFTEQLRYVLRRRVFFAAEELLQAQIAFERHPERLDSPEYHAFREAKKRHDRLNNHSALPLTRYLERRDDDGFDLRKELQARFDELRAFHEASLKRTRQELAINALLGGYDELLVISPALFPADKQPEGEREMLSFSGGAGIQHGQTAVAFHRLLQDSAFALGLPGFSMLLFLTRVAYSRADTRTPTLVNLGVLLIGAAAMWSLSAAMDPADRVVALGLGYALAHTLGAAALGALMWRRLHDEGAAVRHLGLPVARTAAGALVAGLVVRWAVGLVDPGGVTESLVTLAVGGPLALVVAAATIRMVGGPGPVTLARTLGADPGRGGGTQ